MQIDQQRLAEIEARANAATPGPWARDIEQNESAVIACSSGTITTWGVRFNDAAFIAHSRVDIPDLCAALRASLAACERLRAENAELRESREESAEWLAATKRSREAITPPGGTDGT